MTNVLERTARALVTSEVQDFDLIVGTRNNATTWREPLQIAEPMVVHAIPLDPANVRPALLPELPRPSVDELTGLGSTYWRSLGLTNAVDPVPTYRAFPLSRRNAGWWYSTVVAGTPRLTRFELLERAGRQLVRLIASHEVTSSPEQLRCVRTFVTSFVTDGGPTPQLAATEFGAVEVAWVVGRSAVGAIFDDDGGYSVWAEDSAGRELFDVDIDDAMPSEYHDQIASLLADMGARVRFAIPSV